jgi:hypothetical protein
MTAGGQCSPCGLNSWLERDCRISGGFPGLLGIPEFGSPVVGVGHRAADHSLTRAELQPRLARRGQPLVVLAQPPAAPESGMRLLHRPRADAKGVKALRGSWLEGRELKTGSTGPPCPSRPASAPAWPVVPGDDRRLLQAQAHRPERGGRRAGGAGRTPASTDWRRAYSIPAVGKRGKARPSFAASEEGSATFSASLARGPDRARGHPPWSAPRSRYDQPTHPGRPPCAVS